MQPDDDDQEGEISLGLITTTAQDIVSCAVYGVLSYLATCSCIYLLSFWAVMHALHKVLCYLGINALPWTWKPSSLKTSSQ